MRCGVDLAQDGENQLDSTRVKWRSLESGESTTLSAWCTSSSNVKPTG